MARDILERSMAGNRQAYLELADAHLRPLFNYVHRQLEVLEALHALRPGDLTVTGLVNEIFLEALRELPRRPQHMPFYRWLRRLARRVVNREAGRVLREQHRQIPLELPMIATAHPDEAFSGEGLRLVDVLPDPTAPLPPAALERRELEQYLVRLLAHLPERWSEAFLMHSIDGYPLRAIAEMENVSVNEVREWIRRTRQFLQAYLEEEYADHRAAPPTDTLVAAVETLMPSSDYRKQLLELLRQAPPHLAETA